MCLPTWEASDMCVFVCNIVTSFFWLPVYWLSLLIGVGRRGWLQWAPLSVTYINQPAVLDLALCAVDRRPSGSTNRIAHVTLRSGRAGFFGSACKYLILRFSQLYYVVALLIICCTPSVVALFVYQVLMSPPWKGGPLFLYLRFDHLRVFSPFHPSRYHKHFPTPNPK